MKKIYIALLIFILCSVIFSGCTTGEDYDLSGTWQLVGLENLSTGEEESFEQEVLSLNPDGTGTEIYLPCDYYEEYSYIVWKTTDSGNTIEVKHSEEYLYDLNIIDVSDSDMEVSFFYGNDSDTLYKASYEKVDNEKFGYIGCWSLIEYIENGEYYESEQSYLYLYPDGTMEHIYYEVEEQMTEYGSWDKTSSYLMLVFEGYEPVRYNVTFSPNKIEIHDKTQSGADITYVYKRYYGLITNTPPAAYPESFWERISRYFTVFFE